MAVGFIDDQPVQKIAVMLGDRQIVHRQVHFLHDLGGGASQGLPAHNGRDSDHGGGDGAQTRTDFFQGQDRIDAQERIGGTQDDRP